MANADIVSFRNHIGEGGRRIIDFLSKHYVAFFDFHEQGMDEAWTWLVIMYGPKLIPIWKTKQDFAKDFDQFEKGIKAFQSEKSSVGLALP